MDHHLVINGQTVADLEIAATWPRRARGMLARKTLPAALLLRPCGSVHAAGMTVTLDVAFLDREDRVIDVIELRPWALPQGRQGAVAVLEAPQGSFARWGLAAGATVRAVAAT